MTTVRSVENWARLAKLVGVDPLTAEDTHSRAITIGLAETPDENYDPSEILLAYANLFLLPE